MASAQVLQVVMVASEGDVGFHQPDQIAQAVLDLAVRVARPQQPAIQHLPLIEIEHLVREVFFQVGAGRVQMAGARVEEGRAALAQRRQAQHIGQRGMVFQRDAALRRGGNVPMIGQHQQQGSLSIRRLQFVQERGLQQMRKRAHLVERGAVTRAVVMAQRVHGAPVGREQEAVVAMGLEHLPHGVPEIRGEDVRIDLAHAPEVHLAERAAHDVLGNDLVGEHALHREELSQRGHRQERVGLQSPILQRRRTAIHNGGEGDALHRHLPLAEIEFVGQQAVSNGRHACAQRGENVVGGRREDGGQGQQPSAFGQPVEDQAIILGHHAA